MASKKESLKKRAFTLIEVMVAVIIISIIATIALPRFGMMIETTKAKEAVAALQQIRTGERIYRTEEGSYWATTETNDIARIEEINTILEIFLDKRTNRNWDYSITAPTSNTFTATAIRTSGGYLGTKIQIDQTGTMQPGTPAWPLPIPTQ